MKSYLIPSGVQTQLLDGTFSTTNVLAFGIGSSGTTTNRRNFVGLLTKFHHFTIMIAVNSNTSDGAIWNVLVDTVIANQSVTIDQATGVFIDETNVDTVAASSFTAYLYTEGDNTCFSRGISMHFS